MKRTNQMAKHRHRVFEIYEFRDEAMCALTPKTHQVTAATAPQSWTTEVFAVSHAGAVTLVQFASVPTFTEESIVELRKSFTQLAEMLGKDSKVLFDFSDVVTFGFAAISELALFNRKLRTKGSRLALCCLAPTVQRSFFQGSNGHEKRA